MTSTSSEDESGQVKHAASMLMQAVQNLVTMPADSRSAVSSSSSRRRRRKRLRTQLTDQDENCNANEPGPSGVNLYQQPITDKFVTGHNSQLGNHTGGSHLARRLTTQTYRGNDGVVTQQTRDSSTMSSRRVQGQGRDLQSYAYPNASRPSGSDLAEPRIQRIRQLADRESTQGSSLQMPSRTPQRIANATVSVQQGPVVQMQRPRDFIAQKPTSSAGLGEHKRLFGFQPSKQYTKSYKGKGSATRPAVSKLSCWKKKSFCLAHCQQTLKPTPQEKISLAKIGLETKSLVFSLEGNAHHVHSVITKEWPVLERCGGYTLLRLAENSHSLVEIEPPLSGHINVQFLKAILNNATLYIRPLHRSIEYVDMQEFYSLELKSSDDEPYDYCHKCNQRLTLTSLRRHIGTCQGDGNRCSYTYKNNSVAEDLSCVPHNKSGSPKLSVPQLNIQASNDEENESPVMISLSDDSDESDWECDWESDVAVQRCLEESLNKEITNEGTMKIEEIISQHRCKLDNDRTWRITIRRNNVLEDTLRAMKTSTDLDFNAKHVEVIFLGEPAIDEGGPKREFFRLLMQSIDASGILLDGAPGHRIPRRNVIAFKDRLFEKIGNMIALSVIHGGPGPTFFGEAVVDYLIGGISSVKANVSDIPDAELQLKIKMLQESENEQEFMTLLSSKEYEELRKACGIFQMSSCYSEKISLVDAIVTYFSVGFCLAELEQLRNGLSCLNFDDLIKKYPGIIKAKVFTPPAIPLTANYIQDEFHPCFSPVGSTNHQKEEAIVMCWIQYLQHVEAQGEHGSPSLRDIMIFLTGCDLIPPLGFSVTPAIEFTDDEMFPKASTCSLTLTFSRKVKTNFADFKEIMDLTILGSQSFGCA